MALGLWRGVKPLALMGLSALSIMTLFHGEMARAFRENPLLPSENQRAEPAVFFSPNVNLEQLDVQQLRRARSQVDISMYSFTDRELAQVLREIAQRGVVIRVYRDQGQFREEQASARSGRLNTTALLRGVPHLQIRVKNGAPRDVMHQKEYCMDCVGGQGRLRSGSANWSPSAEKEQDNSLWLITQSQPILAFEAKFNEMWNRPSNLIVQ